MIKELEICKICGEKLSILSHFYRKHGLTLEDYIVKYFPKKDLSDGLPIIYKTPESYFFSDFNNKINLKRYLTNLSKESAADYCKNLLIKRKQDKDLKYTPLHIELASLPCFPPIHYLSTLFDYYGFCEGIGLVNKVKQIPPNFVLSMSKPSPGSQIIIDSRENQPLKFDIKYKIDKLNTGDYMFSSNPTLVFDRKSLPDMVGTLSQSFDRFTKELERVEKAGIYLVMLVENSLQAALHFNQLPWMDRVKTKASPEFIFHRLRFLIQQFPNFQPLFVENRKEAVQYMMKGFLSGETFKQYDLQLAYQLKNI